VLAGVNDAIDTIDAAGSRPTNFATNKATG
jgi:hypothetical protein